MLSLDTTATKKCVKSARAVKHSPTTAVSNHYSRKYTNEDKWLKMINISMFNAIHSHWYRVSGTRPQSSTSYMTSCCKQLVLKHHLNLAETEKLLLLLDKLEVPLAVKVILQLFLDDNNLWRFPLDKYKLLLLWCQLFKLQRQLDKAAGLMVAHIDSWTIWLHKHCWVVPHISCPLHTAHKCCVAGFTDTNTDRHDC